MANAAATEAEWSEFEKRLGVSDSWSSGRPNLDNLYVFTDRYSASGDVGYYLFHIDLNSPPESLEPILSWDRYLHDGFVVCGSTLYMFCGKGEKLRPKLTMSTYQLVSPPTPTTTILKSNSLKPGPPMKGRKFYPVVVMIGDFTICVFGTILHHDRVDPEDPHLSPPCFELFDTREATWKSLPEPMSYGNLSFLSINSYCVHRSCLIIQTSKGIHGINVDHIAPQWVNLELDASQRIAGVPFEGMWTMVDKYLFNGFSVMRREEPRPYPFATKALLEIEPYPQFQRYPYGVICTGDVDDRCTDLCRVRVGNSHSDKILFIDIVKFDNESVEKFGPDLSKWHGIKSSKSFCFSLRSCHCDRMQVITCSTTRGALEYRGHSNKPFAS